MLGTGRMGILRPSLLARGLVRGAVSDRHSDVLRYRNLPAAGRYQGRIRTLGAQAAVPRLQARSLPVRHNVLALVSNDRICAHPAPAAVCLYTQSGGTLSQKCLCASCQVGGLSTSAKGLSLRYPRVHSPRRPGHAHAGIPRTLGLRNRAAGLHAVRTTRRLSHDFDTLTLMLLCVCLSPSLRIHPPFAPRDDG